MAPDPDPIPLSALQHWHYCPRQCGLIHLEQVFDDRIAIHALQGQWVALPIQRNPYAARNPTHRKTL